MKSSHATFQPKPVTTYTIELTEEEMDTMVRGIGIVSPNSLMQAGMKIDDAHWFTTFYHECLAKYKKKDVRNQCMFMKPKIVTRYVNLFRESNDNDSYYLGKTKYNTLDEAKGSGSYHSYYVKTISIEVEE